MNSYTDRNSQKAISKSASEENRLKKKAAKKELRRMSKMIKASKNYTTAIGMDLQIIGPENTLKNVTEIKPVLRLIITGETVGITFRKENSFGINIYSRRGRETGFTPLVSNTAVDYSDTREKLDGTKPELREYYAYFVDGNVHTGKKSEMHSIIVP